MVLLNGVLQHLNLSFFKNKTRYNLLKEGNFQQLVIKNW